MPVFDEYEGIEIANRHVAGFQQRAGGIGLKRAESKSTCRIVVNDEIDRRIAKVANPIKKDNWMGGGIR